MRSNMMKAALTAIVLSTTIAGAYAVPYSNGQPLDQLEVQTLKARGAPPQEIDAMPTGAIANPSTTMPAKPVAVHKAAYRPRLQHIVDRIGATNHRIRVDHGRGYLTMAEFRTFEARSQDIRADAMRVAREHRGALPEARYASLQSRVDRLNQQIHRAATT